MIFAQYCAKFHRRMSHRVPRYKPAPHCVRRIHFVKASARKAVFCSVCILSVPETRARTVLYIHRTQRVIAHSRVDRSRRARQNEASGAWPSTSRSSWKTASYDGEEGPQAE